MPSWTEALFVLGLGDRVVGVTEYCVHPAAAVAVVPKVGGTKDPDVAQIVRLAPDLVIANHEENTRRVVEGLESAGLDVWVTYPRTVAEALADYRQLAELGAEPESVASVLEPVEAAVARAEREPPSSRPRVFCPIWKDPWMAVGGDTYAHDLLRLCGARNVFADRGDRRYPIVTDEEVVAAAPEVILLPDEPYAFDAGDAEALAALDVPAARNGRIHRIDGTLVSWYGPRIGRALSTVTKLLTSWTEPARG